MKQYNNQTSVSFYFCNHLMMHSTNFNYDYIRSMKWDQFYTEHASYRSLNH